MKKIILFFSFFLFLSSLANKKQIGSVAFSWNSIGDVTFVIAYKGEEIHPLASWHKHAGGYQMQQVKEVQEKLIHAGKLLAGKFYRANNITFSFWNYFESFFVAPIQIGLQKIVLFDDGTEKYSGSLGKTKAIFVRCCKDFFVSFQNLQKLREF